METQLTDISRVIQLAVAPVFLLTAIATMINALNSRLGRIVDRRRVVQERLHTRVDHDAEMAKLEIRMLAQLQQLPAEDFDVAVTSLGVNDVTARRSLTQWQLQQGPVYRPVADEVSRAPDRAQRLAADAPLSRSAAAPALVCGQPRLRLRSRLGRPSGQR